MPRRAHGSTSEGPRDKKKKTKDVQNDEDTEAKTLSEHKKKKKKSKERKDSISSTAGQQFQDETSPKSKTGKPQMCDDSETSSDQEENFQDAKDTIDIDESDSDSPVMSQIDESKKKKKTKKKLQRDDNSQVPSAVEDNINSNVSENKEKKKKKKRKRVEENGGENNEEIHCREEKGEGMRKKKKKTKEADDHFELSEGSQLSDHHERKEEQNDALSVSTDSMVSGMKKKKKKKKKKKDKGRTQEESSPDLKTSASEGENEIDAGEQDECNSQMNKKKTKDEKNEIVCNVEEKQNEISKKAKKKKKKKEKDAEVNQVETQPSQSDTRKSNLFKDAVFESSEREDQFTRVTGKPSKSEEENGIKLKKKTEVELIVTNDNNESSNPGNSRGQWQGALFENEERQNKFLRLLGGMKSPNSGRKNLFSSGKSFQKKGLFGSLSASVPNLSDSSENNLDIKGGNKALSVSQASDMNKRLEDDYNKAMSLKLNSARGAGLGFAPDPAEGKKFHIDANATKSIKLDDD